MTTITFERAATLLADLVALPTVNPMGRPRPVSEPVERPVVEYLERLFAGHPVRRERQRCAPHHESLLVLLPGRRDAPWSLFESHIDTVPADDWFDRAFSPRLDGRTLYGRGACDDKGCLAAMALALLSLLEDGATPPCPVAFLAAGDEEHAQTGIKHFVSGRAPVGRGVFGEPTGLVPVIQHKGTVRWDITTHGRSAHTSRPELGSNAILAMLDVIRAIGRAEAALQASSTSPYLTGPSLTVTMIQGGRTRNAVPDQCTIAVDFRVLPGMDPPAERQKLIRSLDATGHRLTHSDVQLATPPLNTPADDPFSLLVRDCCARETGRPVVFQGAPYGTDAAWVSGRAPALVLGPGDIAHAHAIDERVDVDEVVTCARIYAEIMRSDPA
jgi:acetylornithine deacetylase